jgi:hypothetical protein
MNWKTPKRWRLSEASDENQKKTTEITDKQNRDTTVLEKGTGSAPPPKKSAKYEQTKTYACLYLLSQYLIVVVAAVAGMIAYCSLRSLNRSVKSANQQAEAAATQAKIAQEQYEASERPWVGLTDATVTQAP